MVQFVQKMECQYISNKQALFCFFKVVFLKSTMWLSDSFYEGGNRERVLLISRARKVPVYRTGGEVTILITEFLRHICAGVTLQGKIVEGEKEEKKSSDGRISLVLFTTESWFSLADGLQILQYSFMFNMRF